MTMAGHFLDDVQRRENAVRLVLFAVNGAQGRGLGDPVHEEITEGRRKQWEDARRAGAAWALAMRAGYHSCGDLVAWVLARLGCRDESVVNRTDDGGIKAWQPGKNVTNITGAKAYRKAKEGGPTPQPGDALFLLDNGGHLAVLIQWNDQAGLVVTADYGQPYGARRVRKLTKAGGRWRLDGRELDGWLDLDAVAFEGPVDLSGVA